MKDGLDPAGQDRTAIAILGSCVSRDMMRFARNVDVTLDIQCQSVVSFVAAPVAPQCLADLAFAPDCPKFNQRMTLQDASKSARARLTDLPADVPLVIDMLWEITDLAVTRCGSVITLTDHAKTESNILDMVDRIIPMGSQEHLALFDASARALRPLIGNRRTIIHRSFYAQSGKAAAVMNPLMEKLYTLLQQALPQANTFELDPALRLSEPAHLWGPAPFHFIDAYYRAGLAALQPFFAGPLVEHPGFSMAAPPGSMDAGESRDRGQAAA